MIIPVRCFTCGKVMADKYDYYQLQVQELERKNAANTSEGPGPSKRRAEDEKAQKDLEAHETRHFDTIRTGAILDAMGLTRYCCRRHMLSTVDMMDVI